MNRIVPLLFALSVAAAPAWAAERTGAARVLDGDTLEIAGEKIRLYGIDAPELHQECKDTSGRPWPCGIRARSELRRIIGTDPVQCRVVSTDRYGRNIAVCEAGGRDLAEEMEKVLLALKPGQIAQAPVLTRFGWHVVRLDRHAPARALPFEAVEAHIRALLRARAWPAAAAKYVEHLARNADIEGIELAVLQGGQA